MKRKPNRSRRIVKKLLKRSEGVTNINRDAVSMDGGKRWVTATEVRHHGLSSKPNPLDGTRLWDNS